MSDNNKKTAVITGGSRGIGRAICLKLAEEEMNLVINYAGNHEAAAQTKEECEKLGANVVLIQGDVSRMKDCEALFEAAAQFGRVDILVNNAGITRDNLIIRMSEEDFDRVIDVNLKGVWNCLKLAARIMIKQRYGRIINLSSVVGVTGNAGQTNYAAGKAGVIGLTKSLARELAARGVTVNAIAPGYIDTDMTACLSDEIREIIKSSIPMRHTGSSEDVAFLAAFLASDRAGYITGQVVHVDGGMAM
ncbi:MAG: 3-oxoacyl-[acyl-carrier-protein] reductase [Oscillospiraceae bacterium]|nr:3-oxoacyl-[acyl-carrier-protein] reductase [Oscillospiraceae bacterium]MDD4413600.1 3-oxoacyl-[acyl-carrier-protein] reductase [Oscillospiraceae bacterium]